MGKVSNLQAKLNDEVVVVPPDGLSKEIQRIEDEYINAALYDVILEALRDAAVKEDTGLLKQSLANAWISIKGTKEDLNITVHDVVDYAEYVEFGRKPGKAPPPDKLIPWVERHFGVKGTAARQIAYLIGRKIAKMGLPGDHKIQEAINRAIADFK